MEDIMNKIDMLIQKEHEIRDRQENKYETNEDIKERRYQDEHQ